jgi:hypothetical protein
VEKILNIPMENEVLIDLNKPEDEGQDLGSLEESKATEITKSQIIDHDSNFFARTLVRRYAYAQYAFTLLTLFASSRKSEGGIWVFGGFPTTSDSAERSRMHCVILHTDTCVHYPERIRGKNRWANPNNPSRRNPTNPLSKPRSS